MVSSIHTQVQRVPGRGRSLVGGSVLHGDLVVRMREGLTCRGFASSLLGADHLGAQSRAG